MSVVVDLLSSVLGKQRMQIDANLSKQGFLRYLPATLWALIPIDSFVVLQGFMVPKVPSTNMCLGGFDFFCHSCKLVA